MTARNGMDQGDGKGVGSFDNDAIRAELRKIVSNDRSKLLDRLAAAEDAFKSESEAVEGSGADVKQQMLSKFEDAKAEASRRYQMILDFIERR